MSAYFGPRPARVRALLFAVAVALVRAASAAEEPVKVMIVGTFHMANPGKDTHNTKVDDVLAPKRQAEIAAVNDQLLQLKPTKVMAEWPAATVEERYSSYVAGTLAPSRNEVVQLGFRLARSAGVKMYGIDVEGDFPFEPVQAFAKAHGQDALLRSLFEAGERATKAQTELLAAHSIGAALRSMNDPARMATEHGFYRQLLRVGAGEEQPGVELVTAWYKRNFRICANLIQLAKPGDRIVVFYGYGHAFLLRQCVQETPGFELVEPGRYLHGS